MIISLRLIVFISCLVAFTVIYTEKRYTQLYHSTPKRMLSINSTDAISGPGLAMMMGFPWSGQNFLQRAVHDMTHTSTAINYGQAVMLRNGVILQDQRDSIPLYSNKTTGPFAFSDVLPFPTDGHVLTRTYCAGHCKMCPPHEYIRDVESFRWECHLGVRYSKSEEGDIGPGETLVHYSHELVTKYIHLVRNPLYQVAARFEHEYDFWEIDNRTDLMEKFPHGRDGFLDWCYEYDDNYNDGQNMKRETHFYLEDPNVLELAKSIPCHSEFFRVIQWHNNALELKESDFAGKPWKTIYYEDMQDNPPAAVEDLVAFLEIPIVSSYFADLQDMVTHPPYYHGETISNITQYMRLLASDDTWDLLSRYF